MSKQTQTPVQAAAADLEAAQTALAAMTTERDTAQASLTAMTTERDTAQASLTAMTTKRDTAQASLTAMTTERDTARASLATVTTERDTAAASLKNAQAIIARDPDALRMAGATTAPGGTKDGDALSQEERVKQYNAISSPRERAAFWARTAPKSAK